MQTCADKEVLLPDIHEIDWNLAFRNSAMIERDVRLFSNTFDNDNNTVLISLFLTGYDNNGKYEMLQSFVRDYEFCRTVVYVIRIDY